MLAAGVLVGFVVVLVDSRKTPERLLPSSAAETWTSDDKSALSGQSAPTEPVALAKSKPSVASPEKVVSVREAYRQALKDEENESPPSDANPPTRDSGEISSTSPTRAATAVVPPQVEAGLPEEPVTVDQPRLWLPAAMLEPDESIGITTELQVAEWEQLQEEFVQAVGGQAPGDESEKEAWVRAQQENDDLFRAKFGWDAFRSQQLKAYMEGLAPAPPP